MDQRSLARFNSKFFVLPNECWYWTGTITDDGYAVFHVQGRPRLAHRVSYEHFREPIPEGLHIDHLCHTWDWACPGGADDVHRRCTNPRHLEAVPPPINSFRSVRSRQTYCINRHELTPENTYIPPSGGRECRTCREDRAKEWLRVHHPGVRHGTEVKCPAGHDYAGDNLIITVTGGRACRECKRAWNREYMRAKRAASKAVSPATRLPERTSSMAELTIDLKKETGGATLTHDGEEYTWAKDGDSVKVPYDWGLQLLNVRGGGFSVADEKAAEKAHEKAAAEAATIAPDEPPRDKPVDVPGLEARAPGGLDLPEAQEQLPERPIAKRSPGRPRGSRSAAKKD